MNERMTPLDSNNTIHKPVEYHALLHEMLRSFTTLARTLNLSHAVKELGSTRQTLRRHITQLEEARGEQLFDVEDRQYRLTEDGENALPEALDILARGNSWLNATVRHNSGLQHLQASLPSGWSLDQQQRPLSDIWQYGSLIMRETMRAWVMSCGNIEDDAIAHVRPYLIVYRLSGDRWICVEFGEKSFYVKWFGWAKARSSIGHFDLRRTNHNRGKKKENENENTNACGPFLVDCCQLSMLSFLHLSLTIA